MNSKELIKFDDMIHDVKLRAKWKRAIGNATKAAFRQGIDPISNQKLFDSSVEAWMESWYKRNNITSI